MGVHPSDLPSPADDLGRADRSTAPTPWEAAYQRFETPEQEVRKFRRRLQSLGVPLLSRDSEVVELFCGRGNGLRALSELGFTRLEGVDLSAALLAEYDGPGTCHLADCRQLPFPDESKDLVLVQGGLHHLLEIPGDLDRALSEMARVLRPGGVAIVVEPWRTPFLWFVHLVAGMQLAQRMSTKLEAFHTMTVHELETYENWLRQPALILDRIDAVFRPRIRYTRWGKLMFSGTKR